MTDPVTQGDVSQQSSGGLNRFITELRQRNVFKVATGYAILGWLIIQLVNAIFPVFDFPRWTSQLPTSS
jgi:hypothetical protein